MLHRQRGEVWWIIHYQVGITPTSPKISLALQRSWALYSPPCHMVVS